MITIDRSDSRQVWNNVHDSKDISSLASNTICSMKIDESKKDKGAQSASATDSKQIVDDNRFKIASFNSIKTRRRKFEIPLQLRIREGNGKPGLNHLNNSNPTITTTTNTKTIQENSIELKKDGVESNPQSTTNDQKRKTVSKKRKIVQVEPSKSTTQDEVKTIEPPKTEIKGKNVVPIARKPSTTKKMPQPDVQYMIGTRSRRKLIRSQEEAAEQARCENSGICLFCDRSSPIATLFPCVECERKAHCHCTSPPFLQIPSFPWRCPKCLEEAKQRKLKSGIIVKSVGTQTDDRVSNYKSDEGKDWLPLKLRNKPRSADILAPKPKFRSLPKPTKPKALLEKSITLNNGAVIPIRYSIGGTPIWFSDDEEVETDADYRGTKAIAREINKKKCENCEIPHPGTFGSGRFCSLKCAQSAGGSSRKKAQLLRQGSSSSAGQPPKHIKPVAKLIRPAQVTGHNKPDESNKSDEPSSIVEPNKLEKHSQHIEKNMLSKLSQSNGKHIKLNEAKHESNNKGSTRAAIPTFSIRDAPISNSTEPSRSIEAPKSVEAPKLTKSDNPGESLKPSESNKPLQPAPSNNQEEPSQSLDSIDSSLNKGPARGRGRTRARTRARGRSRGKGRGRGRDREDADPTIEKQPTALNGACEELKNQDSKPRPKKTEPVEEQVAPQIPIFKLIRRQDEGGKIEIKQIAGPSRKKNSVTTVEQKNAHKTISTEKNFETSAQKGTEILTQKNVETSTKKSSNILSENRTEERNETLLEKSDEPSRKKFKTSTDTKAQENDLLDDELAKKRHERMFSSLRLAILEGTPTQEAAVIHEKKPDVEITNPPQDNEVNGELILPRKSRRQRKRKLFRLLFESDSADEKEQKAGSESHKPRANKRSKVTLNGKKSKTNSESRKDIENGSATNADVSAEQKVVIAKKEPRIFKPVVTKKQRELAKKPGKGYKFCHQCNELIANRRFHCKKCGTENPSARRLQKLESGEKGDTDNSSKLEEKKDDGEEQSFIMNEKYRDILTSEDIELLRKYRFHRAEDLIRDKKKISNLEMTAADGSAMAIIMKKLRDKENEDGNIKIEEGKRPQLTEGREIDGDESKMKEVKKLTECENEDDRKEISNKEGIRLE